jgi:DNA mismatch repair protein MutS
MFRLGDFYEMFYDDAVVASKALSLALTARHRGSPNEAPMCGVPFHAAEGYIARLVRQGHRVAICDQIEDAKQARGIVKRAVTRVVSPGTVTDPSQLQEREPNYIAALLAAGTPARGRPTDGFGCAYLDLSTGEFRLSEHRGQAATEALRDEVAAFAPKEIVQPEGTSLEEVLAPETLERSLISDAPSWTFARDTAYETLLGRFGTASLDGFGCDGREVAVGAAGALIRYLQDTQKTDLKHVTRLAWHEAAERMVLDTTTRRTLEVVANSGDGGREGTLLSVLDRTETAMGARMLRGWLLAPLLSVSRIEERLEAVGFLIGQTTERAALASRLRDVHDLERLLARCSLGTANGRDLVALRDSLTALPAIAARAVALTPPLLSRLVTGLDTLGDLHDRLTQAIAEEPPLTLRDGGIIRDRFHAELDELRGLKRDGHAYLAAMEKREREQTGITSLKVRYNKVFGYYIEISNANRELVPAGYERKQTLVNAERYITPELKEHEVKVLSAQERIAAIEYDLFVALRNEVVEAAPRIRATAHALAVLDALGAFAEAAARHGYTRPRITEKKEIRITDGRHPVVERLLQKERFIPNDCLMDDVARQVLILTGPNMGGKSTYLRQVALIVLMAQAGSFVPAAEAEIGLVDRIFSRVGASDNLARGQSTFLVEMNETANILNNATPRSLILLDEVGRGTSTFDGLSIAWSVAEYLHDTPEVAARTIFATHYHEMTELALLRKRVRNLTMRVREWNDSIVFLRRVEDGAADRSYGIQVARLAGLPPPVIERAREVLLNLEREELSRDGKPKLARHLHGIPDDGSAEEEGERCSQLGLFAPEEDPTVEALRGIDLDALSPLEALNFLAELKKKLPD